MILLKQINSFLKWRLPKMITESSADDIELAKRERVDFRVRSPWLRPQLSRRSFPWLRTMLAWVIVFCSLAPILSFSLGVAGRRFPMDHWAYRVHDDWYLGLRGNLWIAYYPWSWIAMSFAAGLILVMLVHLLTGIGITRGAYVLAGRILIRFLVPRGEQKWKGHVSLRLRSLVLISSRLGANYSYIEALAQSRREKARIHADSSKSRNRAWLAEFVRLTEATAVIRIVASHGMPRSTKCAVNGNAEWKSLAEWLEALNRVESTRQLSCKATTAADELRMQEELDAMVHRLQRTSDLILSPMCGTGDAKTDPLDTTIEGLLQDCRMLLLAVQERDSGTICCGLVLRCVERIEFLERLADHLDRLHLIPDTHRLSIDDLALGVADCPCSLIGNAWMDILFLIALRTSWSDLPRRFSDAVERLRITMTWPATSSGGTGKEYEACAAGWLELFSNIPRRADYAMLVRLEDMNGGRAVETLLIENNLLQLLDGEFSTLATRLQELAAGPHPCGE